MSEDPVRFICDHFRERTTRDILDLIGLFGYYRRSSGTEIFVFEFVPVSFKLLPKPTVSLGL
jgi:hypothetical protein